MRVFNIYATKDGHGKKHLTIKGFVTSKELNAIKEKMKKMNLTVEKLPIRKSVEICLFDCDLK